MWRRSRRSNNDANDERLVCHRVDVANKYGIDCGGGFQLVLESILISNSEGARFAPNIASFKAALHSEGARTFPTILSAEPHGPSPKLIVICDWTKISFIF